MKISKKLVVILLACAACVVVIKAKAERGLLIEESKTQPKDVVLCKDSQSDKYGEAPFSHENHATKNTAWTELLCFSVECHHTDQPATALKPPLKLQNVMPH